MAFNYPWVREEFEKSMNDKDSQSIESIREAKIAKLEDDIKEGRQKIDKISYCINSINVLTDEYIIDIIDNEETIANFRNLLKITYYDVNETITHKEAEKQELIKLMEKGSEDT